MLTHRDFERGVHWDGADGQLVYLPFLSSNKRVRYFWRTWSTRSPSGMRFSVCLSFSKDFTCGHAFGGKKNVFVLPRFPP